MSEQDAGAPGAGPDDALARVEERLREAERRFRVVFDHSPLAMGLTLGETGTYAQVNDALCVLLGRDADELVGMSAVELLHPEDVPRADPAGAAALAAPDGRHRVEMRFCRRDGEVLTTLVTLAWVTVGDGEQYLLSQLEDVTARRAAETMLRDQAERDALTGLPNRAHLSRVLGELAVRRARGAAIFVDLDAFKLVNDTRGHDVGDQVLVEVAGRLGALAGPDALVARLGGDELVVLLGCGGEDRPLPVDQVAGEVERALARPVATSAGPVQVTASLGTAEGRVHADDPMQLVQRADTAMYRAKTLGRNRRVRYGALLHRETTEHRRTEASLRTALDEGRLRAHYQPVVELCSGQVVGFEALMRVVDPDGALMSPASFITVAEQSGLIVPLGAWVLRESCRALAALRRETGRDLRMSVNVAARQASRPDLSETVIGAIADAGVPEHAVSLELTETALLQADDLMLAQLLALRERGLGISLDDFGTGYSSLTHLRRFPVTELKVDRSFVEGMVTRSGDRAIVVALTGLAEDLGLGWVAEGIETTAQWQAVSSLGGGLAQGYLFGPPVPLDLARVALTVPPPGQAGAAPGSSSTSRQECCGA